MRASDQYICLSRKRRAGCGYTYLDFLLAQFDLADDQSSFGLVWLGILLVSSCENGIISGAAEELAIRRFCNMGVRKLKELIVPCPPSPALVQRRVIQRRGIGREELKGILCTEMASRLVRVCGILDATGHLCLEYVKK